jgi:hypothetical protein
VRAGESPRVARVRPRQCHAPHPPCFAFSYAGRPLPALAAGQSHMVPRSNDGDCRGASRRERRTLMRPLPRCGRGHVGIGPECCWVRGRRKHGVCGAPSPGSAWGRLSACPLPQGERAHLCALRDKMRAERREAFDPNAIALALAGRGTAEPRSVELFCLRPCAIAPPSRKRKADS